MNRDPVLASKRLAPGGGYRVPRVFRVEGGLHYIKGNSSPYFTLTYTAHRVGFPNQCESGGAGDDEILKHFPRFADLAALHLCDINGSPMHAVENGWYWLAGALGGAGQQYHGGNSKQNFPVTPPADKPWQDTEYRLPTPAECLAIFAKHCRCSIEEAQRIADRVRDVMAGMEANFQRMIGSDKKPRDAALAVLREEMDAMRPRWKAEAEACIAKHGLRIYGDPWQPVQALEAILSDKPA